MCSARPVVANSDGLCSNSMLIQRRASAFKRGGSRIVQLEAFRHFGVGLCSWNTALSVRMHALLSVLGAPLDHCNEVFLAAGYAPRYAATPLQSPALDVVHAAIEHILQANNPAPAIVLDNNWDITAANVSSGLLLTMAGVAQDAASGLNLLDSLFSPGGLGERLANAQEVRAAAWQRASREAAGNPALAKRLNSLGPPCVALNAAVTSPVMLTRVCTAEGELAFVSTFTTFGMPLDITVESMRIEHLIPADRSTRQRMLHAFEQWSVNQGNR